KHAPRPHQQVAPDARAKYPVHPFIEHRGNSRHILGRRHELLRKRDTNFPPQNLNQNPHSAVVVQSLELTYEVGERASYDLDGLALLQVGIEADIPVRI